MARDSRIVIALKKQKKEILKSIALEDAKLGVQLFKTNDASVILKEDREKYYGFDDENKKNENCIHEIEKISIRLKKATRDVGEAADRVSALKGQWPLWYKTLGQTLYTHYSDEIKDLFFDIWEKACEQEKKLTEAKKAAGEVKDGMQAQSFFSKLFSQVKVVAANNTIATYSNRFNALLEKMGRDGYENDSLKFYVESSSCNEKILRAYSFCAALKDDIQLMEKQVTLYAASEKTIREELNSFGAHGVPEKRISQLERSIESTNQLRDAFAAEKARSFITQYIDEKGNILKDFPQTYGNLLAIISDLRSQETSLTRLIEIQKLKESVETAEKYVKNARKKMLSNTQKIEALKNQNEDLSKRIEHAAENVESWCSMKAALEMEESLPMKRIKRDL